MVKEVKLHIGCGTVYLDGWINVHPAPDYMAVIAPEIVEQNLTTVDRYYKDDFDNRPKHTVADIKSTIIDLPNQLGIAFSKNWYHDVLSSSFPVGDMKLVQGTDEVLLYHVLEHIPQYDLDESLTVISRMLKPGGRLRLAVPDFDGIVLEYAEKLKSGISEEEKEWYYRFVHGTQKDKWSHHFCGYNEARLMKLLGDYGFDMFENLPNQNFYPAIHMLATKAE